MSPQNHITASFYVKVKRSGNLHLKYWRVLLNLILNHKHQKCLSKIQRPWVEQLPVEPTDSALENCSPFKKPNYHCRGTHLIKFGHFTFYTKLLDDNINMSALIEEMSWFCRFLFVVFTMSREPLLTKFSCVDAPPLKKLPKKTRRSFWQETISTWSPPCYSDTNSSNNSHWGFKSCRWNFRKEQIYSLESYIYTRAWGQNNFPRAGEVAIVGTNFKRQHWSCKFYTGKLSTTSHRCNWEKGIFVREF